MSGSNQQTGNDHTPIDAPRVMISSTFEDLKEHRNCLGKALTSAGFKPEGMEDDKAKAAGDIISSSMEKIRVSKACFVIISHRYGQIPECSERNPDSLSITELEFNEARTLGLPIVVLIMGDDYPVVTKFHEPDSEKKEKLAKFKQDAKQVKEGEKLERIYVEFNSLHDFELIAQRCAHDLKEIICPSGDPPPEEDLDPIPKAPEFYAEPPYIGSHKFVGRKEQLKTLDEWAASKDDPLLLFEAIGGAGKSMLTWHWMKEHAPGIKGDWAGRFWYSFYEKGAVMDDFCQRTLAYITGKPLKKFEGKKTAELSEQVIHHLQSAPYLIVFDGIERILVEYHRFDAAQLRDEEASSEEGEDDRHPCDSIRPDDDEFLRRLAGAGPSKLLLTTRLTPRSFVNDADQTIPGVRRQMLPGLDPPEDAEALLRSCGIHGDSAKIQQFLKDHCGCHPLVTGVLGGLISHYFPDRGNFDAWSQDPDHGGRLNLANLELTQKRNHILASAYGDLPSTSRQLLGTLSLISEAVNYETLSALNPHLPPPLHEPPELVDPTGSALWALLPESLKPTYLEAYEANVEARKKYEKEKEERLQSTETKEAVKKLEATVTDLEKRGFIQYNKREKRFDLHPVIRGFACGKLDPAEKKTIGKGVVDHFTALPHVPYKHAKKISDLRNGIHILRTLIHMERFDEAFRVYRDLENALCFNLEANVEELEILRPFFQDGWSVLLQSIPKMATSTLANNAGWSLNRTGRHAEAIEAYGTALEVDLDQKMWSSARSVLNNLSMALYFQNKLRLQEECLDAVSDIATLSKGKEDLFRSRLSSFRQLSEAGRGEAADDMWDLLDPMGRNWSRVNYRQGEAEYLFALHRYRQGELTEDMLNTAESLADEDNSRETIRNVKALRGEWFASEERWEEAEENLNESTRMAREVGQPNSRVEALLALAKFELGRLTNPKDEATRVAGIRNPAYLLIAELWHKIGNIEEAEKYAAAGYEFAWADGGEHVHRFELDHATALLKKLDLDIPVLPVNNVSKGEELPHREKIDSAIRDAELEEKSGTQLKR